jgi:hypothetical protein
MVLRMIQERRRLHRQIIVGMLGVGWSIATFLVVPVLVTRDVGPVEAVRESATLLKRTWGENIIGQGGIGLVFGLIQLGIVACGFAIIGRRRADQEPAADRPGGRRRGHRRAGDGAGSERAVRNLLGCAVPLRNDRMKKPAASGPIR